MQSPQEQSTSALKETALYFLRLGAVGFGGPLALIASMQKDLVENARWIEPEEFARAFPLIKAMPGPVAFQLAVYLGRRHAGGWGGAAAGFGLVFPAFILMILFGALLGSFEELQEVSVFLAGMQAAALGLILASVKGLLWPYRAKTEFWLLISPAAVVTYLYPSSEPLLILGLGATLALTFEAKGRFASLAVPTLLFGSAPSPAAFQDLFWASFKAGALVFGSGIAIVPLMEHDFVDRLGWLTHAEFMNALAFGQVTPGPIVITGTFIGFKSLGLIGACVATIGIFAAPFFHMMTWFPPLVDRLAKLKWITPFLTGAIAAVVGAILATSLKLALPWSDEPLQLGLIAAALIASLFAKIPAWTIIPLGGVITLASRILF